MSQIGYMFLAAGIGAYANAMFHLMTHAFFKALLFLAAGIVIHALVGEQDMKMGGLRKYLPRTYWGVLDLGDDLGLAVELLDPEVAPKLIDERQERDRLAERDAASFEPRRSLAVCEPARRNS